MTCMTIGFVVTGNDLHHHIKSATLQAQPSVAGERNRELENSWKPSPGVSPGAHHERREERNPALRQRETDHGNTR